MIITTNPRLLNEEQKQEIGAMIDHAKRYWFGHLVPTKGKEQALRDYIAVCNNAGLPIKMHEHPNPTDLPYKGKINYAPHGHGYRKELTHDEAAAAAMNKQCWSFTLPIGHKVDLTGFWHGIAKINMGK